MSLQNTSRYTIFDVTNLLISMSFDICNDETFECRGSGTCHIAAQREKQKHGKYIATRLYVRLWTLVTVKAKANLIGIIPHIGICAEYN